MVWISMSLSGETKGAKHIGLQPQRHSIVYDTKVLDVVLMGA